MGDSQNVDKDKDREREREKKKKKNPAVAPLSGAIAGGIETIVVWPLENIKTQLQLMEKMEKPPFKGVPSCAKYIWETSGLLGFYRGMLPVLSASVPKAGIRFGLFDYIQRLTKKPDGSTNSIRTLASGTIAGAVEAALIVTPAETLKTRLIHTNQGVFKGTISILKKDGLKGIYRGTTPTILKQSSNQGLRFMAFGIYRNFILKEDPTRALRSHEALIGGMFAGCFSTLTNNPADMLKTRMQGENYAKYKGFIDCLTTVVKEEGILKLWAGVGPRLLRVIPGQGVIFMSYTKITQLVETMLDERSAKNRE